MHRVTSTSGWIVLLELGSHPTLKVTDETPKDLGDLDLVFHGLVLVEFLFSSLLLHNAGALVLAQELVLLNLVVLNRFICKACPLVSAWKSRGFLFEVHNNWSMFESTRSIRGSQVQMVDESDL
eukprot:TRINITY_DN7959_c0_g1_i5.p1 TRINITY_DN7959_c0_g1~~TRINITY_DN7959_c0_g1_i5.p1  ORF type:complete len:124 (-),score=11.87 TRINITY_DN7959_c0_g1_i5:275-646(-)